MQSAEVVVGCHSSVADATDEHVVLVEGIDRDRTDSTGYSLRVRRRPHLPGLAAVGRSIHAVTCIRIRGEVRLTGAAVQRSRVGRIDCQRTDLQGRVRAPGLLPCAHPRPDSPTRRRPQHQPRSCRRSPGRTRGTCIGPRCLSDRPSPIGMREVPPRAVAALGHVRVSASRCLRLASATRHGPETSRPSPCDVTSLASGVRRAAFVVRRPLPLVRPPVIDVDSLMASFPPRSLQALGCQRAALMLR